MKTLFRISGVIILLILFPSCKKDELPPLTKQDFGSVTDIDGNVYKTIKIGTQIWMTENLKTTKYNNGTEIQLVTDPDVWANLNTLSPARYCWYNNNIFIKDTYGALYNWFTVNSGILCPIGWHVPTDFEWSLLFISLGGEMKAGGEMKEVGTTHWKSPNTGATNSSGFTALPGGFRFDGGTFESLNKYGLWWTATEGFADGVYEVSVGFDGPSVYHSNLDMNYGVSVRCIKDN